MAVKSGDTSPGKNSIQQRRDLGLVRAASSYKSMNISQSSPECNQKKGKKKKNIPTDLSTVPAHRLPLASAVHPTDAMAR